MLVVSAAFAVLLTAAFVVLMVAMSDQREASRAAVRSQQAIAAAKVLETSVTNLDNGVRGYVATGRRANLRPFERAQREYPAELERLRTLVSSSPTDLALVGRVQGSINDYVALWGNPLIELAKERLPAAQNVMRNVVGRERIDAIRRAFDTLAANQRALATSRRERAENRADIALWLGVGGILLVIAVSVGLALYLRRAVVRPVQTVAEASEAVAAGDLATRVPATRQDELGTLARGFNHMTESLETRTAELERSNRDLESFAAVASHDLQGPLVTISMLAERLALRLDDHEGIEKQLADHIRTSTGHLHDLVRDLLAYSRLGRGTLEMRPVDLDDVLRQALDNLAGPIDKAGAVVVADPLPEVQGDERRLCQVIQNLVSNGVKFSNGGEPRVEIRAQTGSGRVHVAVADNGIGFDPEEAEQIFRPFHRLHSVDTYEGSGIGLAIVERIVVQHGGRIWAEGRKGEGATFHLELPLAERRPPAPEPAAEPMPVRSWAS